MRQSPFDNRPERRALRIFALDPMLARGGEHRVVAEVPFREIERGDTDRSFYDDRLEVIDYDATSRRYYRCVNLDDPQIAMQQGLEPTDGDPQFHQQMVYAVASRVLEVFDRALGRKLRFSGGGRLRLLPHAFQARNAYYDWQLDAVLFGYFPADTFDPGANLPGQLVFTCLSHDIVAHEVTHAALDRLHKHYREPTSPEVPALHEGFADAVALFLLFTYTDIVRDIVRRTRGDLRAPSVVHEIGRQFGAAAGLGGPLRRVGDAPDPRAYARAVEPHALGRLLLAAIFDAFVATYERRSADLIRIATGGSGRLPEGDLHPDLVARLADECCDTAQKVLSMIIRSTDYMPPVDPSFSDFLRAMVTADSELNRTDEHGLRAAMIEAFRLRGIRPEAVGSLAVGSLRLPIHHSQSDPPDAELAAIVGELVSIGARDLTRNVRDTHRSPASTRSRPKVEPVYNRADFARQMKVGLEQPAIELELPPAAAPDSRDESRVAARLQAWAKTHRGALGLDPDTDVAVTSFHSVHRVAPSGELLIEMIAKFVQTQRTPGDEDLGGLEHRAGATIVATLDGKLRYVITKPFSEARAGALRAWVARFDADHGSGWKKRVGENRLLDAFSARAMDARRLR